MQGEDYLGTAPVALQWLWMVNPMHRNPAPRQEKQQLEGEIRFAMKQVITLDNHEMQAVFKHLLPVPSHDSCGIIVI